MGIFPPGEILYDILDYADEMSPADGTLEGWAKWLSQPDEEWGRSEPTPDGETFEIYAQLACDDIIATRGPDGWKLSRDPEPDLTLIAVRWAEGTGWSADNIIWGEDLRAALIAWLNENDQLCDDIEHVATARDHGRFVGTYHANPPRLELAPIH